MNLILIALVSILAFITTGLLLNRSLRPVSGQLETLEQGLERLNRSLNDELRSSRSETAESVQRFSDAVVQVQSAVGTAHGQRLDGFSNHLSSFSRSVAEQVAALRSDLIQVLQSNVTTTMNSLGEISKLSLEGVEALASALTERMTRLEARSAEDLSAVRHDSYNAAETLGNTLSKAVADATEAQHRRFAELANAQEQQWTGFRGQVDTLRSGVESKVENLRNAVDQRLRDIQQDNATKLDQMRQTVDDRLQVTLEARLGDTFRHVSERLEQVHKGLGEMQVLATGVGDLKRVLTNVRARGTWGEVQLGTLLEQVLAPDQYATNVATTETASERVEFAIRLPGRNGSEQDVVLLPIDSKFPLEDYQTLLEAADRADAAGQEEAARRLEARVKASAKEISTKYVNPPKTADFAIMFLPNEGLYAEVLRRAGLVEMVQREHRVLMAGPTTLWAILTSLQIGFKTLAIERRSSEVWALLGAVKAEFGKFGSVLDGIQKNLHRAATKIDEARKGTRTIQRKLTDVQELPPASAAALFDGAIVAVLPDEEGFGS